MSKQSGFLPVHHPAPDPNPVGTPVFSDKTFDNPPPDTAYVTEAELQDKADRAKRAKAYAEGIAKAKQEELHRKTAALKEKYSSRVLHRKAEDMGVDFSLTGDRVEYRPRGPETAQPVDQVSLARAQRLTPKKHRPLGINATVAAAALEVIAYRESCNLKEASRKLFGGETAKRLYVEKLATALRTRAHTDTATTTDALGGASIVNSLPADFLADLPATSVITGLLAAGATALDFENYRSITLPKRVQDNKISGSFVQQGGSIPVKAGLFGSTSILRTKVGVITTMTDELFRTTSQGIVDLLEGAIKLDTQDMLDAKLLSTDAPIPGITPGGLFNGAPTQASAGNTLGDVLTDLRFLQDSLVAQTNGNPKSTALILHPKRTSGLRLLTNANGEAVFKDGLEGDLMPFDTIIESINCPEDRVFSIDASEVYIAMGDMEFRVSRDATVVMLNDDGIDPTMLDPNAVSLAGSVRVSDAATVTGGPAEVVGMLQQYGAALQSIMEVSWATSRGIAAYLTAVNW